MSARAASRSASSTRISCWPPEKPSMVPRRSRSACASTRFPRSSAAIGSARPRSGLRRASGGLAACSPVTHGRRARSSSARCSRGAASRSAPMDPPPACSGSPPRTPPRRCAASLAVLERPAEQDEAGLDEPVHESGVLIPAFLLAHVPRPVPRPAALEPDDEEREGLAGRHSFPGCDGRSETRTQGVSRLTAWTRLRTPLSGRAARPGNKYRVPPNPPNTLRLPRFRGLPSGRGGSGRRARRRRGDGRT